ncbi:MAG: hypothetical protein IJS67_02575, partial [Clostridia bacterium]|nr:hypothetical protein [Clostridia bacterium]
MGFSKKIKTFIIAFLSGAFALCVFLALPLSFGTEAAEGATVSDEVVFYDSYQVNTEITVPNSPIYYGGRQYASEIKVIYPDGSAVILAGKKLLLNQNGKYEIIYYTMANGQYLSVSKVFYVSPSTVSFSGNKSSYYYGSHGKYAKEKEGLVVELAQGETMYYNNIVNLSEMNGGKVFSMFATPVSEPMADATRIYVTFTDIYDTSNYVQVLLKFAGNGSEDWSNNNTYCQARASNQSDFVGLEANTGASAVSVAGGRYLVSRNGTYGSPIIFTLGGYINSQYQIGDIEYGVSFDLENKIVYSKTETSTKPISDLKSSLLYDSVWQGFTTGEVFISISAENYNGSVLGFVLTDIGGQDLTKETVTDIPEPSIIVDYDGYDKDSLPDAIVGQRYPVARARAYDAYCGELEYSVKAYYGYDSSFATQVDVNDGYFKPTREGYYTLEYSATNSYGLKKVVTYKVKAVTSDKELGITIEGKARSGGVGNEVKVAEGYSLSNVNGKADVIITATNISNPSVVYTIGEDLTFIPFYSGFYKIVFSYSDYIFNKTEDYNVNVSASAGSPIIVDEPALPDRFIIGKKYRLPVISGYIFPNGTPEEKQCDIYVADGNSPRRKLDGNEYVIGNYETVSVVYVISDGTKSKEKAYTIKTVNVSGANGIDTAKY